MWDKLQVVTYAMLLVVALWVFAATFEPLRTRSFGRPVAHWLVMAMRVMAALAAVLALVILVLDIVR
jgi:hypothetical protein